MLHYNTKLCIPFIPAGIFEYQIADMNFITTERELQKYVKILILQYLYKYTFIHISKKKNIACKFRLTVEKNFWVFN